MRIILLFSCLLLCVVAGKDFYKLLGVKKKATKKEIKKAYRDLSRKLHPDKNKDDPKANEKFTEIAEAYSVLTNDEQRQIYDQYGEEGLKQNGGGAGFNPFDVFSRFGHASHRQAQQTGAEIVMDIEMTLEELFSGASFEMEINKQILCPVCQGSGAKDENDVHICTSCGGHGIKVVRHQIAPGFFQQVQQHCDVCSGKGKVIKKKCPHCKGEKTKRGSHEFTLEIEKGMGQGQKIVFEGEADESPDANAGNLVFVIQTLPHEVYTRVGENLYMEQVISLKDSLLGFKRSIKQLDGEVLDFERLDITPPGFVMVIKEHGFPKFEYASERGDLFIEFRIAFPKTISSVQRSAIETF